ncbi:thiamine pyrophosphate-binding protein [Aminobacter sp. AP02]|uniref:thiamine pyrophosphate-binding protein n=1 Tax=Aminobacter sp. AP02 TaxID=2135737 RepID=UPI000D6D1CB3|nr:thiamine pyrophosphate-binding protein [Aminobacter sp. AP02]PWK60331.1 thiamine pyrophosphate-dependent acetolactate synthase large subunit-like protein [Aminobacter sp. AP02]
MKVFERIADAFVAEGTRAIFGLIGDGNMFWLNAMHVRGVKFIDVRHEGAGLGMADGWARASREVGVATATNGPGVPQLATGLITATRASSPVVAFVGESSTKHPEHIQRMDQRALAKACEAEYVEIYSPEVVDWAVQRAFYIARSQSKSVVLACARDIQQKKIDVETKPYVPSTALLPNVPVGPTAEAVAAAADAITDARKPVIVVGRGALWSQAGEAVKKLAQLSGALLACTMQAKTYLAEDDFHVGISGGFGTDGAIEILREADLVIGVGASLNSYTTKHGYPNAKFVQIDILPHRVMDGGRAADVYVHADARIGVERLVQELERRGHRNTGFRTAEIKARIAGHFEDKAEFDIEPGLLDPREVCNLLDELLPLDCVVHSGSGTSAVFPTMHINRPRLFMGGKFWACMGQSMPSAIGAAAALGRPVALIEGDGSTMMHLAELETSARHKLPFLTVVLNDQALGSEYYKLIEAGLPSTVAECPTPDLGAVMRSFGGRGTLATTIQQVRAAVEEWIADPVTTVIDARITHRVSTVPARRGKVGHDA